MGLGVIESNAVLLDQFALEIRGLAGGMVNNRTGLAGRYDLTLHFAVSTLSADPTALADDPPQFVTALREQLGLKLVPEKTNVKIFVVDHIEQSPDLCGQPEAMTNSATRRAMSTVCLLPVTCRVT